MHGGVRGGGGVHTIAFSPPFSPLASVRPALAAAVAASCVEALKKKEEPQNAMYVVPISAGNTGHTHKKKSTTACAMGRLDLNIRYPCLDSRSAPPPCALQLNMGDGRNKYPNEEEQSDAVRATTRRKKEKGERGDFFMGESGVWKSA